jgi:hypothetical protein
MTDSFVEHSFSAIFTPLREPTHKSLDNGEHCLSRRREGAKESCKHLTENHPPTTSGRLPFSNNTDFRGSRSSHIATPKTNTADIT